MMTPVTEQQSSVDTTNERKGLLKEVCRSLYEISTGIGYHGYALCLIAEDQNIATVYSSADQHDLLTMLDQYVRKENLASHPGPKDPN